MNPRNILTIVAILASIVVTGCVEWLPDAHKIDIQQGNIIEHSDKARIHTGMNKKQILYVLGTPAIVDPFHNSQWEYLYYLKPGDGEIIRSRLTLHFRDNLLQRIDDSEYIDPSSSIEKPEYKKPLR